MVFKFTEPEVEGVPLNLFDRLGYAILHGPEIAPGELAAERSDYTQAVLKTFSAIRCSTNSCPARSASRTWSGSRAGYRDAGDQPVLWHHRRARPSWRVSVGGRLSGQATEA